MSRMWQKVGKIASLLTISGLTLTPLFIATQSQAGQVASTKTRTTTGIIAQSNSSIPTITRIDGATGPVGINPVLTIHYTDADCDVIGGQWDGALGSDLTAYFEAESSCSQGVGTIQYTRSCYWNGTWREYMTLIDSQGNRSAKYAYTYTCTLPNRSGSSNYAFQLMT